MAPSSGAWKAGGSCAGSGETLEKDAGNRKKIKALLAMLRILDFIPTKQKAFEVVGSGCILEAELGKRKSGGRETSGATLVSVQTSIHSLDQPQGGDEEK